MHELLPLIIFPALFTLGWILHKTRTNEVLMFASFFGIIGYYFTNHYAADIVMIITVTTIVFLSIRGDVRVWWQLSILIAAFMLMALSVYDQETGTDIVLSQYEETVILLTILQLVGVFYGGLGILERAWRGYQNLCIPDYNHHMRSREVDL